MNKTTGINIAVTMFALAIALISIAIVTGNLIPQDMTEPKRILTEYIVSDMAREYELGGDSYLDAITNTNVVSKHYPFSLDYETQIITSHGADPLLVGTVSTAFDTADKTKEQILDELENNGFTWISYTWMDYDAEETKTKHSYLVKRGNVILGSGYYD